MLERSTRRGKKTYEFCNRRLGLRIKIYTEWSSTKKTSSIQECMIFGKGVSNVYLQKLVVCFMYFVKFLVITLYFLVLNPLDFVLKRLGFLGLFIKRNLHTEHTTEKVNYNTGRTEINHEETVSNVTQRKWGDALKRR